MSSFRLLPALLALSCFAMPVAQAAGLSQGIINLHFESKDNLLTETLRTLANEYRAIFDKTLAKAAGQLRQQVDADRVDGDRPRG